MQAGEAPGAASLIENHLRTCALSILLLLLLLLLVLLLLLLLLLHFWSVGCRRWQDQSAGGSLKATCEVQFCRAHMIVHHSSARRIVQCTPRSSSTLNRAPEFRSMHYAVCDGVHHVNLHYALGSVQCAVCGVRCRPDRALWIGSGRDLHKKGWTIRPHF